MSNAEGFGRINSQQLVSKPMLERIISATCLYFGCTEQELMQKTNARDLVYRRKLCFFLIMQNVYISNCRLGQRFGGTSYTTVSRQVAEIDAQQNVYAQVKHDLQKIKSIADTLA